MAKFIIQPHGRLQEWIAQENGYFADEGLECELLTHDMMTRAKQVDTAGKVVEIRTGAYESYVEGKGKKGDESDISCACHWAVNQAAANNVGKVWGKAYVVTPGAVMVRADSDIETPDDLKGREIAVGYHSGSHFATIQAMEPFLDFADINLKFVGMPWQRVDAVVDGDVEAGSMWGLSFLGCEQLGLRKIADTSFMIAFLFPQTTDEADVEKYMNALKRAQMDLDLEPEKYKHLYLKELPERYADRIDVRRFGPGERIVFLPYTERAYADTQMWMRERGIFEDAPEFDYAESVVA
jgi:ABC-type nitrate/sulfonate/bicarbonate transport system substrate-binding protein